MAVKGENSLYYDVGFDTSGVASGINDIIDLVKGMTTSLGKLNPFGILAIAAGAAFTLISKHAQVFAKEFETSMKKVEAVSEETERNFGRISTQILEISKLNFVKPTVLAEAFVNIVKAGYDGAQGLKVLESANKLANVAMEDVGVTAKSLTKVLQAYGAEAVEAGAYSEILFKIMRDGDVEMKDFLKGIEQVAPLAAKLNIPFEELANALVIITSKGVSTGNAMRELKSTIAVMNSVLTEGWQGTISLAEGLQLIYEEAGGSEQKLKKLVKSQAAVNTIMALAGENLEETKRKLKEYGDIAGDVDKKINDSANSTDKKWAALGRSLELSTTELGKFWNNFSGGLADFLNGIFETTDSLEGKMNRSITTFQEMVGQLENENIALEDKEKLLKDLTTIFPEYVGFLDDAANKEKTLAERLKLVSGEYKVILKQMEDRRVFAAYEDDLLEAENRVGEAQKRLQEELRSFQDGFNAFNLALGKIKDSDGNREFDFKLGYVTNLDDAEKEIKELEAFLLANKDKIEGTLAGIFGSKLVKGEIGQLGEEIQGSIFGVAAAQRKLNKETAEYEKQLQDLEDAAIAFQSTEYGVEMLKRNLSKINDLEDLNVYNKITGDNAQLVDATRNLLVLKRTIQTVQKEIFLKDTDTFVTGLRASLGLLGEEYDDFINGIVEKRNKALGIKVLGGDDKTDFERFQEELNKRQVAYQVVKDLELRGQAELAEKARQYYELDFENYQEYLNQKLLSTTDIQKQIEIAGRLDEKDYGAELDARKDEFAKYEKAIELGQKQLANELKKLYGLEFDNFQDYLQKKLLEAETVAEKIEIAMRFDPDVLDKGLKRAEKLSSFSSADAFRAAIFGDLEKQFRRDEQAVERSREIMLNTEKDYIQKLKELRENEGSFALLNQRQLIEAKKQRKILLEQAKDDDSERGKAAAEGIKTDLLEISSLILAGAQYIIGQVVAGLQGAAELFAKFGNDEMSKLLNQIAGVGQGIQSILKGDVVGGLFQVINSAITVEIEADTEKFEKQIDRLANQISILGEQIARELGTSRLAATYKLLEKIIEKEEEYIKAIEAEESARRKVKVLGITLWDAGSGTDEEKLRELELAAEAARTELYDLRRQLEETLTGTTIQGLGDRLLDEFKKAEEGAADFGKTFEEVIKDALINSFKVGFLEEAIAPWLERFAELSDNAQNDIPTFDEWLGNRQQNPFAFYMDRAGGASQAELERMYQDYIRSLSTVRDGLFDLSPEEIEELKNSFNGIVEQGEDKLAALNDILEQAGIAGGLFGTEEEDPNSLRGSIKNITEDTAEVLAGTLNAIRIDVRESYLISLDLLTELRIISDNTSYNRHLESMDGKLSNIETLLG